MWGWMVAGFSSGLLEFRVASLLKRVMKASVLLYGQLQLVNATPHFLLGDNWPSMIEENEI